MSTNENIIPNDTIVIASVQYSKVPGERHREVARVLDSTIRKGMVEYFVQTANSGRLWLPQTRVFEVEV